MKNTIKISVLLFTLFIVGCKSTQISTDKVNIEEVFTMMQGSFSSERLSTENKDYYNISLHMYPIWKDKGHYLYVEQAINENQSKPYRQRIYKLILKDDYTIISEVYTIKNEKNWIGKWKTPDAFANLSINDIELKNGCEVVLKKINDSYEGKTGNKTCPSELNGASYATSEVVISKNQIVSWDRGFDKNDQYIWGAKNGGYLFDKL